MTLLEDSFLHPATFFVILGLILPFLRGNFWRVLLFIPPGAAIFLTLHAHVGIYWEVDYVGQALVLGRVDTLSLPVYHSVCLHDPDLHPLFFSCTGQGPARGVAFFHGRRFRQRSGRGLLDPLYVLAGDDRFFILSHLAQSQSRCLENRLSVYDAPAAEQRAASGGHSFKGAGHGEFHFRSRGQESHVALRLADSGGLCHQRRRGAAPCMDDPGASQGDLPGAVLLSVFGIKTALYAMARCFAGLDLLIVLGALMAFYGAYTPFFQIISGGSSPISWWLKGVDGDGHRHGLKSGPGWGHFPGLCPHLLQCASSHGLGGIIYATRRSGRCNREICFEGFPSLPASPFRDAGPLCRPFFGGFTGVSLIFEEALKLQGPLPGPFLVCAAGSVHDVDDRGGDPVPLFAVQVPSTCRRLRTVKTPPWKHGGGHGRGRGLLPGSRFFPQGIDRHLPYPVEKAFSPGLSCCWDFYFRLPASSCSWCCVLCSGPGLMNCPIVEVLYALVGRGVMAVLSKPLSWMDGIWSEIYRTVFLRAFGFMAVSSDIFDRKGIDGAVNQTAFSVMFLSRISTRLQSSRLQDQLARMMLLALAVFALIWFW
jgi:multicomponent Na+:H+ antiporter subunit D